MPEIPPGIRARLPLLSAGLSSLLVVSALAGFTVGIGSDASTTEATTAVDASVSTTLPLRNPAATPSMTASPSAVVAPVAAASPTPTQATAAAVPGAPSAAQRDRDLAAWLASSGAAYTDIPLPAAVPSTVPAGEPDASVTTTATPSTQPPGSSTPTSPDPDGETADFVLSSFNVLGSSHTRNGARGRAAGVVRIRGAAQLLAAHDVGVVGLQELQADQARGLVRASDGAYALYPGAGRHRDSENSIGWRTSQFQLVRARTISIPYFDGHHRQMPYVLLKHRGSGVQAWFGNFHNPAETSRYHHQQGWRTQATHLEAGLANRLAATGAPVFITGDMNERAAYFCRLTSAASSMVAAQGGSNGSAGCRAPSRHGIDWVFGSRGVRFSSYAEDRSPLVHRTTDHPVVTSHVRVGSGAFPGSVRSIP